MSATHFWPKCEMVIDSTQLRYCSHLPKATQGRNPIFGLSWQVFTASCEEKKGGIIKAVGYCHQVQGLPMKVMKSQSRFFIYQQRAKRKAKTWETGSKTNIRSAQQKLLHVYTSCTVPSCRSRRTAPGHTRLCSSAPCRCGRRPSWSGGNLAPAHFERCTWSSEGGWNLPTHTN